MGRRSSTGDIAVAVAVSVWNGGDVDDGRDGKQRRDGSVDVGIGGRGEVEVQGEVGSDVEVQGEVSGHGEISGQRGINADVEIRRWR